MTDDEGTSRVSAGNRTQHRNNVILSHVLDKDYHDKILWECKITLKGCMPFEKKCSFMYHQLLCFDKWQQTTAR